MPTTFHDLKKEDMAICEIEWFGEVDKTYHKVWPNTQLSLYWALQNENIVGCSRASKESPVVFVLDSNHLQ